MSLIHEILKLLADGKRHSGVVLASRLGVSRAAVSKAVAQLPDVPISVTRAGYSAPSWARPLEESRVQALLEQAGHRLDGLVILEKVDSTNQWLLSRGQPGVWACLAESQTAGRGRRGRAWQATPYGGLILSVGWTVADTTRAPGVLSLGSGVAVARALAALGVAGVALKWPNDVLWQARKLAGILIEMRGEADSMRIVIGVGLNCALTGAAAAAVDQEWVDLRSIVPFVDRDRLAALVIGELMAVKQAHDLGRTQSLVAEWRTYHAFAGLGVRIQERDEPPLLATILDVDEDGALIVDVGGARRRVRSGEVSVRRA